MGDSEVQTDFRRHAPEVLVQVGFWELGHFSSGARVSESRRRNRRRGENAPSERIGTAFHIFLELAAILPDRTEKYSFNLRPLRMATERTLDLMPAKSGKIAAMFCIA
jgi:hypothetical protein